jgi:sec-independent protein translocase protein TatA
MPNIGPLELIIVLVIVLVIFGPKRLPGLGRQLGGGMREFKDSLTSKADKDDEEAERPAAELTRAEATDPLQPAADLKHSDAPSAADEPTTRRGA